MNPKGRHVWKERVAYKYAAEIEQRLIAKLNAYSVIREIRQPGGMI